MDFWEIWERIIATTAALAFICWVAIVIVLFGFVLTVF